MTDLETLFEKIRKLPPGRQKQIRNYAESVASGRSREVRRRESADQHAATLRALEKKSRARHASREAAAILDEAAQRTEKLGATTSDPPPGVRTRD